jgi:hypothetical protein
MTKKIKPEKTARERSSERWHKRNYEYKAKYARQYRKDNPIKARLSLIKGKCKSQGIPFDLNEDDIQVPERCPVLDVPLDWLGPRNNRPSVDRIIPSKGYVGGNVRMISLKANELKGANTLETLERIKAYLEESL